MTTLTDAAHRSAAQRRESASEGGFAAFALVLSFGLAMLGLVATAHPRPDTATGEPFFFVLRP